MSTKKQKGPPKKTVSKRSPTNKSAVGKVNGDEDWFKEAQAYNQKKLEEITQKTAPKVETPKKPPPPTIKLKQVKPFTAGTIANVPDHIRGHVTWDKDGTITYTPELETVGPPRNYTITVTVEGATETPAPATLKFQIVAADPELTVEPLKDFEYGTEKDIPALIKSHFKHKSTGEIGFDPDPATVKEPDEYTIRGQVPAHGNYKQSKAGILKFKVLKLKPELTVGKPKKDTFDYADAKMADVIERAVKKTAGGDVVFVPPPAECVDPGEYEIEVYTDETEHYEESKHETIKFEIVPTSGFKSDVFKAWDEANKAFLSEKSELAKKIQTAKYNIQMAFDKYATRSEIEDELNGVLGVPSRLTVWNRLGYDLKSNEWTMGEKWTTNAGIQYHFTVSANSITVPTSRAAWGAAPPALFTQMFMITPIATRVHMTLEVAPTPTGRGHVFLGGKKGDGRDVKDTDWGGQAKELKDQLVAFRTRMLGKIQDIKNEFNL